MGLVCESSGRSRYRPILPGFLRNPYNLVTNGEASSIKGTRVL